MATPKEALTGTSHTININSNAKASPSNLAIGNQDTVTFQNNDQTSNATVTFLGAGADEFDYEGQPVTTATVPAGGSFGPLTPNTADVTVNYDVQVGSAADGPFAIEVGTGPLEIDIVDDSGNTNLEEAEIPNNGTLFFENQATAKATISFGGDKVLYDPNGNPVDSVTVDAGSSSEVLTGKGTNKEVTYSIAMSLQTDGGLGGGNGTIKVGQT
jgi:hypothetical protein